MSTAIIATLKRSNHVTGLYINFVIRGEGSLELDSIFIEPKTKGKHRDKACWSICTHYKALSIGDWLYRLGDFGFDVAEFKQACIELGWEKEVEEYYSAKELNSGEN